MRLLGKVLTYFYYLFILGTFIFWMSDLIRHGDHYLYPWIWAPAAVAVLPLFFFRDHTLAVWIMLLASWGLILIFGPMYFPSPDRLAEQALQQADGQEAMGNVVLALVHWILIIVAFIVALLVRILKKPSARDSVVP